MVLGAFYLSAVKLVLGMPWDLERTECSGCLERCASIQPYTCPVGVHFDKYDLHKHDMTK